MKQTFREEDYTGTPLEAKLLDAVQKLLQLTSTCDRCSEYLDPSFRDALRVQLKTIHGS